MKKRLLGVLLVGALALTPSISAFAAIDESQESEKLYMMDDLDGDVKTESPIHLLKAIYPQRMPQCLLRKTVKK